MTAYDPYCNDDVFASSNTMRTASLNELLHDTNMLNIHVEQNTKTINMLSAKKLQLLPHNTMFVNTTRAQIADQETLTTMLRDRHLSTIALDMFNPKPIPPSHPILQKPNTLILPHIDNATVDAIQHHSAMIRKNLKRLTHDKRPLHCANPTILNTLPLH